MLLALALAHLMSTPAGERLRCVSTDGRIEITTPRDMDRRIRSLAVVDQAGRWLTLVDEDHQLAPFRPGVRRFILLTRRQQAVDPASGAGEQVRAFRRPGVYRLVFSDNLETEPENMTLRDCVVRVR